MQERIFSQEELKCPRCSKLVTKEANNCRYCGQRLADNPKTRRIAEGGACRSHHEDFKKTGSAYCPACGVKL